MWSRSLTSSKINSLYGIAVSEAHIGTDQLEVPPAARGNLNKMSRLLRELAATPLSFYDELGKAAIRGQVGTDQPTPCRPPCGNQQNAVCYSSGCFPEGLWFKVV
ncbi:unnamed protein product [Polarella glacialis]|uniref:Uncharacterized protein n=1 Tax=Polarella glacialis TaxID=89957 RepID=A0A813IU42_POLGL|nr:unnamed protein product [Polarella glacialis]